MSDIPFPLLIAFLFLFGCLAILQLHRRQQEAQRALPDRADYLSANGQSEPACLGCGSRRTREFGLNDGEDHRRVVACAECDRLMYQYLRDDPD